MFPADEQPFLAAIVAHPADDAPRLVYADYLDETGQARDAARAELIRVQIALHSLPPEDARRAALAERESELLEAHRAAWTAPLSRLGARFAFRRGLPDTVALDAARFLERGDELFDNTTAGTGRSFLTRLHLEDVPRVLPALAACPLLSHVEELDLANGDLGNGGVAALLACTFLRNLRVLELGENRLDDAGAATIARTSSLPRLESLGLHDNDLGADGAAALAESPFLAGLRALDLAGNEINEHGLRSLLNGSALQRLTRLRLADNPLRDGVIALAASPLFDRITRDETHLDLHRCGIESDGAAALAASPAFTRIEHLDLNENYLGDAGVAALAGCSQLRSLNLVRNQITDAGAAALLTAELPRLERLDVSNNRLTKRGVESLKAAAQARGFSLTALHNGTETMAALPAPPAAQTELERVVQLKRGLAHPAARPAT